MVAHRRQQTRQHKKRIGHHHNRGKHYLRVYSPYLPLTIIVALSILLGSWQPVMARRGTLAYATNTSVSGLLAATNNQRAANGKSGLSINGQLNSAAQAKANDMVARNYWSHNTPDGQEPWIFLDSAGYNYTKAGENLAYGFLNSDDTVIGWMNSPSHKANMLDGGFSEVGFGFANSSNFVNAGQQTVVVAMYGQPQTLAATASPAPATPAPTPVTAPTPTPSPTNVPVTETAPPAAESAPAQKQEEAKAEPVPVNTEQPVAVAAPTTQNVTRIQALTEGKAPWALGALAFISAGAVIILLLRHSLALRHLIRDGEKFILHHPLLDVTLVSLALLGLSLSYNVGFIL